MNRADWAVPDGRNIWLSWVQRGELSRRAKPVRPTRSGWRPVPARPRSGTPKWDSGKGGGARRRTHLLPPARPWPPTTRLLVDGCAPTTRRATPGPWATPAQFQDRTGRHVVGPRRIWSQAGGRGRTAAGRSCAARVLDRQQAGHRGQPRTPTGLSTVPGPPVTCFRLSVKRPCPGDGPGPPQPPGPRGPPRNTQAWERHPVPEGRGPGRRFGALSPTPLADQRFEA